MKNHVLHNLTSLSSLFPDKFLSISLTGNYKKLGGISVITNIFAIFAE